MLSVAGKPLLNCGVLKLLPAAGVAPDPALLSTDANGFPLNWSRSSEALLAPPAGAAAGAGAVGGAAAGAGAPPPGIPKRSRMLGVPFSSVGMTGSVGGAANGLVALCCSCNRYCRRNYVMSLFLEV